MSDTREPRTQLDLVIAFAIITVAITAIRLWFCWQLPVNSGDVVRHIYQGLFVLRDGPASAGIPLRELAPELSSVSWSLVPYGYPPVTLAFFTGLAALSPTIAAVKIALTGVEALNAVLLGTITRSRWLGLAYWASPVSIWWVSGEAQFEPLQAGFMFGAVLALRTRPALAAALLGLGIQVKLSAVLLLPWVAWRIWNDHPERRGVAVAAFALSLAPIVAVSATYSVVGAITGAMGSLRYNPYHWNVLDSTRFLWNPGWLVAANAVATLSMLGALIWLARRSEDRLAYLAPILFLIVLKSTALSQFWYILLMPAFLAPIPDRKVRAGLILATPLLDVRSSIQLLLGPFGWIARGDYTGLLPWSRFRLP